MNLLVGRGRELAELRAGLTEARAGRPGVLVLRGEAGIGKTSLAKELAQDAGTALWATADRTAPAFWPWRTLLAAHVARTAPATLAAQIGECGAELARLVPELRRRLPGLDLLAPAPEAGRYPLFLAVARLLGAAALTGPLAVVLDDLQCADTDSLLLFDFLAAEVLAGGLLLVATVRAGEAGRSSRFQHVLGGLLARPGARLVQVGGLSRRAVGRLAGTVAGRAVHPAAVEAVHRRTEGNPFFVGELVRSLDSGGLLNETIPPGAGPAVIPPGVDAVVAGRLAALSRRCRTVVCTGAVVGRSFTLDLVRELTGEPEAEVLRALEEALAAGLLREAAGDRFSFRHPLVHEAVAASIAAARRVRLHRRITEQLGNGHAADLAHHWAVAGGDPAVALTNTVRAAEHAAGDGAHAEAAALYEQAVRLAPPDRVGELLVCLGHARRGAGETASARQAFLAAAATGRARREHRLLGRAALGLGGGWDPATLPDEELLAVLAEALAGAEHLDPALAVELRARHARALGDTTLATRAVAAARDLGRPGSLLAALVALHGAGDGLDADRRGTVAEEITALADTVGDPEVRVLAAMVLARTRLEHADRAAATTVARRAVEYAATLCGEQYAAVPALVELAWSFVDGRFAEAERILGAGPVADDLLGPGMTRLYLMAVRREQGRLAEAGEPADLVSDHPAARFAVPALLLDAGRAEDAGAALAATPVNAATPAWGLAMMAEACVELADRARAVEVYGLLRRHTEHALVVSNALLCLGPADRALGLLAGLLGRVQDAVRHFEVALGVARRLGARPALARTRVDLAGVLLERGRPDDRARARRLLEPAVADATELGMAGLRAAAERLRSRLATGAPAVPEQDSVLTSRELQVLTLVAKGLANKQIARALEVSDKTVKAHVSNILAKVGAADRTQAAIYAMRNGLA